MRSAELYWIKGRAECRIAIMARPRAADWLEDEVAAWKEAGLTTVVSLLERAEILSLGLSEEAQVCAALGIDFLSFPIPDRAPPGSLVATDALLESLRSRLQANHRIGIHCRAGIGRSALIAACLLWKLGEDPKQIFTIIEQARGVPVPDTEAQRQWLTRFIQYRTQTQARDA
jgi:protein-tyrosine phosphatase